MNITGQRTLAVPIGQTLSVLADPRAIAEASGVLDDFDQVGDAVRVRLSPQINMGTHAVSLAITAIWQAENRLEIVGHGGSGEHAMQVRGELEVSEAGQGTLIRWQADVVVMGVLAAVGQRALPWIARDQLDAAFDALEAVAKNA